MDLDINTPEGQKYLKEEQFLYKFLEKKYPLKVIQTPKEAAGACDGFFINLAGRITGVIETKCRPMSVDELNRFKSWLVTYKKIEECRKISAALKVPFFGLLYLYRENVLYLFHITDSAGRYKFKFDVKNTETQETCNGGKVFRRNAYLPIIYGEFYEVPK